MTLSATWRTDEPCPECGTLLYCTGTPGAVTHDCPACGWTATSDLTGQTGGSR